MAGAHKTKKININLLPTKALIVLVML